MSGQRRRDIPIGPALALALLLALPARALDIRRVDQYRLEAGADEPSQLWLMAEQADVGGIVRDDLFLLAQSAGLGGQFENDLWTATSEDIRFQGQVSGHARLAAARSIEIAGRIGSSLSACANTIQVGRSAAIGGDVVLVGENIVFEGSADGESRLIGYRVTLGGRFGGNVRVIADDIAILAGTVIDGDLVYSSSQEVFLDPKVELGGKLVRQAVQPAEQATTRAWNRNLMIQTYLFLGALFVGILWLALFRRRSSDAARLIRGSMWRCALVGTVAFCLMPMVALFSLVTVIGWPLAGVTCALFGVLVYGAKIVAGLAVGSALLRVDNHSTFGQTFLPLALGLVVLYFLAAVPMLGLTVWFTVTVIGLGGLILSIMNTEAPLRRPAHAGVSPQPPALPTPPGPGRSASDPSKTDSQQDNIKEDQT